MPVPRLPRSSPILVGSLTDRFFAAQKVLAVLMFAGAILMYFAAQQTQFSTFFPLLLAYPDLYADHRADQQHRLCKRR